MNNSKKKRATVIQPDTIAGQQPTASPAKTRQRGGRKQAKVRRQPRQGKAGSVLRNSIDLLVIEESVRLAEALVDTAIHGSVAGVKLVAGLTGAMNLPKTEPPRKKERPRLTFAQRLPSGLSPEQTRKLELLDALHNRRLNPHLNLD